MVQSIRRVAVVGTVGSAMLVALALNEACVSPPNPVNVAVAAGPTAKDIQCAIDRAKAGDGIVQIGETCFLDVGTILSILFANKEPAVMASKAYAEAVRARKAAQVPVTSDAGLLLDGGL